MIEYLGTLNANAVQIGSATFEPKTLYALNHASVGGVEELQVTTVAPGRVDSDTEAVEWHGDLNVRLV